MPIFKNNIKFSRRIEEILYSLKLIQKHGGKSKNPAVFSNDIKVSIAVINLSGKSPVMGGYNMDEFIYPASLYKIFIAAEARKRSDANEEIIKGDI